MEIYIEELVFSICGPQVFLYTPGKHSFHYEGVEFLPSSEQVWPFVATLPHFSSCQVP